MKLSVDELIILDAAPLPYRIAKLPDGESGRAGWRWAVSVKLYSGDWITEESAISLRVAAAEMLKRLAQGEP